MDTEALAAFTEWTFKFTDAFSATAGVRYTEETKGLQATMFNVAPATARRTAGADGAVPVRRPAADADRLPVPHHQPLRARIHRDHDIRERAVPLQSNAS